MGKRKRCAKPTVIGSKPSIVGQEKNCYEGKLLDHLLNSVQSAIVSARHLSRNFLPEKIWFKQQFAIGINEVTRALEQMGRTKAAADYSITPCCILHPSVRLQAILIASDCNTKWSIKHVPIMASTRNVPIIMVKDNKRGSLRLSDLVRLKTAVAIGVKSKGSDVNEIVDEILNVMEMMGNTVTSSNGKCTVQSRKVV